MRCARPLLVLLCALALAACGSEERAAEVTEVPSTTTSAPATPTATATETETTPPPTTTTGPTAGAGATGPTKAGPGSPSTGGASAEDTDPGGAGDEEPIRQPARFEVGSISVTPASVTVAPFLTVELKLVNVDEGFHEIKLIGTDVAFTLQGGQTVTKTLPGLKAGVYTIAIDGGKDSASLVVGDEAGP